MGPDDTLISPRSELAYPPTKSRPYPQANGSDLIGRAFFEPDLGVCLITRQGPVAQKQMFTRAEMRRTTLGSDPAIALGSHHTLAYKQIDTGEEHFSSLAEILHWIDTGPLLQPPKDQTPVNTIDAPVTTPVYVPASLQYVPRIPPHGLINTPALPPDSQANPNPSPIPKPLGANRGRRHGSSQRTSFSLSDHSESDKIKIDQSHTTKIVCAWTRFSGATHP
jgi:hypothetical protein